MNHILLNFFLDWNPLIYACIFFGMMIEGEVVLFTAFFLVYHGHIGFYQTIFFALTGIWVGDFSWFLAGPYLEKIKFIQKIYNKFSAPIDKQLVKRPYFIAILSKFVYGINRLTLLRARLSGVKIGKFIGMDIAASVIWVAVIASLAGIFSASLGFVRHYFKIAQGLLLAVLLFIIFSRFLSAKLKEFFEAKNNKEDPFDGLPNL